MNGDNTFIKINYTAALVRGLVSCLHEPNRTNHNLLFSTLVNNCKNWVHYLFRYICRGACALSWFYCTKDD